MLKEIVGLGQGRLLIEKLFALEGGEEVVERLFWLGNHLAHQTQRELAPNDGQLVQEGFLIGCQSVDAGCQHPLHGGGDMECARRSLQSVLAALAAEHALFR